MSESSTANGLQYRDAGVDIDAGNTLVAAIKPHANATKRPGVMSDLGGFAGFFDLKAAGFDDPVLVAATDGVGTKLRIAVDSGIHDGVGIDLVAMCANDLVVQGASPLFFLDYLAAGSLDVNAAEVVIAGIAEGCRQADCALIGGETAEMPGMYSGGDYDLAGFCVGAVERGRELTGRDVSVGDSVVGLSSNGVHANGFSLVRKVLEIAGLGFDAPAPFEPGMSIAQLLLKPTRIYVRGCLAAIDHGGVHALAHITGGGLIENIPRVLPDHLCVRLDCSTWEMPAVFPWVARAGGVPWDEMFRAFNCGIGMVLIVDQGVASRVMDVLHDHGEVAQVIGHVDLRESDGVPVMIENRPRF